MPLDQLRRDLQEVSSHFAPTRRLILLGILRTAIPILVNLIL